ncbi:hypothetical protein M9Y10_037865 [Tritrichomonas musculus]|uniref:Uncharacterized protein n=1 Tax=Tritrichomonas musculus TaxID=1915356 RepID=A0ABR2K8M8_9EUKA
MNCLSKKIYGQKTIGGAVIKKRNEQYGYFPLTSDQFFIIFLQKIYNLKIDEENISLLISWYNYLDENHLKTDDCEFYTQSSIAGCNISSRNILFSPKKKNHFKETEKNKQQIATARKSFIKHSYLKSIKQKLIQ